MPIRDYASVANKIFHVYCDSAMADDSGDGRSWATAKKTLAATALIIPDVCLNHLVIHLKGTHSLTANVTFSTIQKGSSYNVLIDGGDDVTIVDGPYTATSGTVNSLTDTARSWGVNALRGYTIEILDGAAAGYIYTIQSNTADTIYVGINWPSPGTPQYRITKPATTLTAASYRIFDFAGSVDGRVSFQRLTVSGKVIIGAVKLLCKFLHFGGIVYEAASLNSSIFCYSLELSFFSYFKRDPDNPASYLSFTSDRSAVGYAGTGMIDSTPAIKCYFGGCSIQGSSVIYGLVNLLDAKAFSHSIYNGALARKVKLTGSTLEIGNNTYYGNSAIIEGSDGIGIDAKDSRIRLTLSAIVQNNASHGIALDNSILDCEGTSVLSGTGNGGAGIYVHGNSKVTYPDGYPPTITGTVGDIAITDPTLQEETWAEIDAADGLDYVNEAAIRKVS